MPKPRGRRVQSAFKERVENSEATHENSIAETGSDVEISLHEDQPQTSDNKNQGEFSSVFYGLVDSAEIDYFKQAESTLNANVFESDEDRAGFIRSVLEESRGKELKLVTNQICSKLMERLVLFASDRQLKHIFHQFLGHFPALAHHKYSSHVLETLLVRSAALVEKEIVNFLIPD